MIARCLIAATLAWPLAQMPLGTDQDLYALVLSGWVTARAMAPNGGASGEAASIIVGALQRLDEWRAQAQRGTTPREAIRVLELQYADATIRAAADAAQDERDEMAVYLLHARYLSTQLELLGSAARWPLPIDEVDGELWLEVDRYQESRAAYQRAASATGSPRAWIGLARASDRLGDTVAACDAYRTALKGTVSPEWETEAIRYIAASCGSDSRLPTPDSRLDR